ncbi:hypothetical protein R5H32_20755 [Defluviimonas sp. D31]|uniref:hypothetical protein n=1 Tax=Defluviimonas sp. D31 TaxID=3083253 RepID=UPI00296F0C38|nr:hypothetical protein [Defluviimonas sp. D31]MDW4551754.1 hypothetical protein [Defluviimonas sp. D31]
MTSNLRKTWSNAKNHAIKNGLPADFLPKNKLGPKLDKAEKSYDAYTDYTGQDKIDSLKKAAQKAVSDADNEASKYLKLIHMGVKGNNDHKLHKALHDLETVLSMKVIHELNGYAKFLHGGKKP